eukprot:TRINITY_DN2191_c0_g1_i1.p1 TRINITY_DN2191_c0_g1~~TRINITY_DN2191_c0_g1_i1.p1  ORF type:complete len:258 (+),score=92.92 TRINITY_DN2191_c0_g1_i1:177-950(+)
MSWEIFDMAKANNVKRVRELLDSGVDIDGKDYDHGNTALHSACSNGSTQTMELLIQRGAQIDPQNDRGFTPLMVLVTKRYDALALWMIKKGASLTIKDKKNYTALDMAQGFFQNEMKAAEKQRGEEEEQPKQEKKEVLSPRSAQVNVKEENLRIYFANGSYKTFKVTPDTDAKALITNMVEKLNLPVFFGPYFDVYEVIKDQVKRLNTSDNLLLIKSKWPVILGNSGNETNNYCHFLVKMRITAPNEALAQYEASLK